MNDTPSSSTEKTVVVHQSRFGLLTILSLVLNGLFILLILFGIIAHHHRKHHHMFGGRDGGGGSFCERGRGGFHHHFHHFGGGGWGGMRHDGMDRGGRGGHGDGGGWGGGGGRFAENGPENKGFDDGGGMGGFGGGMRHHHDGGGMGMMGGGPKTPPDPAKMTDAIVDHLGKQLTLTDDEKAKIKPVVEAQVTLIQKEMATAHQAVQKDMEDGKAKIKALLTPDQQKQLDAMPLPGDKPAGNPPAADDLPAK